MGSLAPESNTSTSTGHVELDVSAADRPDPTTVLSDDEQPTSSTPLVAPDPAAQTSFSDTYKDERERYERKRKTLIMSAGISAIGTAAVIATLATAIKSTTTESASTTTSDAASNAANSTTASPTLQPSTFSEDTSEVDTTESTVTQPPTTKTPSPTRGSIASLSGSGSSSLESVGAANTNTSSSAAGNGATAVMPAVPGTCALDTSMDSHLMHVKCPFAGNTNGGFAMDKPCIAGETCVYACEPPYVCTENGFSDTDCVPYLGRCDPYSASTYSGGLRCNADGSVSRAFPDKPLCALGLNTSVITSSVQGVISACQTVYPGNEAPMIGIELRRGNTKQLTSFPQWYWHGTHSHFYVSIAYAKAGRDTVCQWNYDPLSLNSGGVDAMPYVVGGGALSGHACSECGQHNLAFGDNFDFRKAYSGQPTYGVRVRNCNDITCGEIQCDATYRLNNVTGELESYWAVYNTIYGNDTVGCVADAVRGNSWSGLARDTDKFTQFEFYPIDLSTGMQMANCSTCSASSMFDASRCLKLRDITPARFGTGVNPAVFVCTPTGGALGLASKLVTLAASTSNAKDTSETTTVTTTSSSIVAVQVVAIFALCAVATLMVVAFVRLMRQHVVGAALRDNDSCIETPKDELPDPLAPEHCREQDQRDDNDDVMEQLRAATPIRRKSAMPSASGGHFASLDE